MLQTLCLNVLTPPGAKSSRKCPFSEATLGRKVLIESIMKRSELVISHF